MQCVLSEQDPKATYLKMMSVKEQVLCETHWCKGGFFAVECQRVGIYRVSLKWHVQPLSAQTQLWCLG